MTALVALAAVALAACGGGGSSSSSEESSGSGESKEAESSTASNDPGVEEVNELAAELQERPTSIGITQPVGKSIPSGKEIWWISCGVPACVTLGETFTEGAKELGWTTKVINTDGTPGQIKSAWEQAVTSKPDAVASSGTDVSQIAKQLGELEAEEVPVVQYAIPEKAPGVTALIGDAEGEAASFGEPMAAFIAADSGNEADTLLVTIPSFPILGAQTEGFERIYKKGCPECGLTVDGLPLSALGKDVPERIVSKLRSDPGINYVAMAVDDLTIGLPAALKSAGLGDVKIVGASSGPTNYQYVESGQQAAAVPNAFYEDTWQMVDALARIFTGQSPKPSEVNPPRMLLTAENLISNDATFPLVADYKEQFLKLWGK